MAKRKRRPYNGQKKKGQTMIHKTSDPTTCTARKTVGELRCSYIIYIFVYVWSFETYWGDLSLDPLREIFFEGLTLLHFLYIFTKVN
jgi:hypothetical protein